MKRTIERVLAIVGAAVSVGSTIALWQNQSMPGVSLWPFPALVLLEIGILGLAGLVAVALDSKGYSLGWGLLTWGVTGGLLAVMLLGVFSIGPMVFPAVLAFCGAALSADWRRGRRVPVNLALAAIIGVVNGLLLLTLVAMTRS